MNRERILANPVPRRVEVIDHEGVEVRTVDIRVAVLALNRVELLMEGSGVGSLGIRVDPASARVLAVAHAKVNILSDSC